MDSSQYKASAPPRPPPIHCSTHQLVPAEREGVDEGGQVEEEEDGGGEDGEDGGEDHNPEPPRPW